MLTLLVRQANLFLLTFLLISSISYGQVIATTEDGKKAILNPDGTYRFIESESKETITEYTSFLFQGKKYVGTQFFYTDVEIGSGSDVKFFIAKNGGQGLFNIEIKGLFSDGLRIGNCIIFLDNLNSIQLIDRRNYSDINDRIANTYFLTLQEIEMLKKYNIKRVRLVLMDPPGRYSSSPGVYETDEIRGEERKNGYFSDNNIKRFVGTAYYVRDVFNNSN